MCQKRSGSLLASLWVNGEVRILRAHFTPPLSLSLLRRYILLILIASLNKKTGKTKPSYRKKRERASHCRSAISLRGLKVAYALAKAKQTCPHPAHTDLGCAGGANNVAKERTRTGIRTKHSREKTIAKTSLLRFVILRSFTYFCLRYIPRVSDILQITQFLRSSANSTCVIFRISVETYSTYDVFLLSFANFTYPAYFRDYHWLFRGGG